MRFLAHHPVTRCLLLTLSLTIASRAMGATLDPDLNRNLSRIERAFRQADAETLRQILSSSVKVRVDIRDLTDGPSAYGAGQLQVVFKRIFSEWQTRNFTFHRDEVTISAPRTAFARAEWTRRSRTRAEEVNDTLTFTLREEDEDWRIHEIRSSR